VDLTPLISSDRQVIERYGPSGFRISGVIYRGSVLIFPDRTIPWAAGSASAVSWETLAPVVEHGGVQILLLGLGRAPGVVESNLRSAVRAAGIALEPMDTAAACRTDTRGAEHGARRRNRGFCLPRDRP
jgi:uncharacterized protein